MHRWLPVCLVAVLVGVTGVRYPARPLSARTGAAWAMPGHDPQRTAQGAGVGPQRATLPHVVLRGFTSRPPIIGPDGTLYGFLGLGTQNARIAAVNPGGRVRWTADASLPTWWSAEPPDPYPVLGPDGSVSFNGGICPRPAFVTIDHAQGMGSDGCLTTVGKDGRLRWHVATRGLTKGGPQVLVEPDGRLVRATIGPSSGFISAVDDARRNITLFAPNGRTRRLGGGCSWVNTALGADGTLYAIAAYDPGGPCPQYTVQHGHEGSSVVAFTTSGDRAWMTPLPAGCLAATLTIDTRRSTIYASTLCTVAEGRTQARVYSVRGQGQVHLFARGRSAGGSPTLALDRRGGDIWIADAEGLRRFSPAGAMRWGLAWHVVPGDSVRLAIDARGTAYVGGDDGLLRTVSPAGHVIWQYQFSIPQHGFRQAPPNPAIGADGELYVSTPDGFVVFHP